MSDLYRAIRRPSALRPVALAAALALLHSSALTLPVNPQATFGQTKVTQTDGQTLRIDQTSARAGIDWQSFSIGAGELVRVVQPDGASVLVNRVKGLDPSLILGRLQANGRVFLTNPRGVIFGEGAQVDVGALVATTLSLADADAQVGRWSLKEGSEGAAAVRNDGSIRASGGTVVLLAPQVENRGSIEANRVGLGAGSQARVDLDGDGLVLFDLGAAAAARLDQLGSISANGGRIELRAAARGALAGSVLNLRGATMARGLQSRGGEIVVDGGSNGVVWVDGRLDASGQTGGDVLVQGQRIMLDDGARLDASGGADGGRIRVGGDFHGANAEVRNADMLIVRPEARLNADAGTTGHGGRVVLWSEQNTVFLGSLSARGGSQGGNGGQAEVSGRQGLSFEGASDLSAAKGQFGQLLLDPNTIDITNAGSNIAGNVGFADAPSNRTIKATGANSLQALLGAQDVVLQASDTITVTDGLNATTHQLTLQAGGNITVNSALTTGGLVLSANDLSGNQTGTGRVITNADISASTGVLTLTNNSGSGVHSIGGNLTGATLNVTGNLATTAGVQISTSGTSSVAGSINLGNDLTVAGTGNLTLGGAISESSASALVKAGTGTLTLAGANTYSGGTTISAGSLRLGNGGATGNLGVGVVTNNGEVLVNRSDDFTLANVISGSGTLIKQGNNNLTLTGVNTHSGGTSIEAGQLTLGASGALGSGALNMTGGTLNIGGFSNTVTNLMVQNSTINGAGGLLTAGDYALHDGAVINANLGTGTLTSDGVAAALNAPAAATTVNVTTGRLTLGAANLLADGATVNVSAPGILKLGGNDTITQLNLAGQLEAAASATLTATAPTGYALNGGVTRVNANLGAGALSAAGTSQMDGTTAATTLTVAPSATLTLGAPANRLIGSPVITVGAGGTLTLQADNAATSVNLGAGAQVNGPGILTATDYVLDNATYNSDLGGGTLTSRNNSILNGHSAATSLLVETGSLTLGSADRLTGLPDVTINPGANLALGGHEQFGSLAGAGTLAMSGHALQTGSTRSTTFSGIISGSSLATLTKEGPATTFTLGGASTSSGLFQVQQGTLLLTGTNRLAAASSVLVDSGAILKLNGNQTLTTATVAGTLDKTGAADTLTATSYALNSGAIINADLGTGTLNSNGDAALNGTAAATTVNVATGTLTLGSVNRLANTAALSIASGATLQLNGNDTVGSLTSAGTLGKIGANDTLTAITYALSNGAAVDANLGAGSLTSNGSVALNGTAAAATVTVATGTLTLGAADRLAATAAVDIAGGAVLRTGGDQTLARLTGTGSVDLGGSGTLTLYVDQSDNSFDGNITGNGNLLKDGSAVFTLGSLSQNLTSTYTGSTTVRAGTLLIGLNEALPSSTDLQVRDNASLDLGNSNFVQTVGSFGGANVRGTGTLNAGSFDVVNGGTDAGVRFRGGNFFTVSGNYTMNGNVDADSVAILSGGTLTLGSGNHLASSATVTVNSGGALQLNGNQAIGQLVLSGTLDGNTTDTLTAFDYTLQSGAVVNARLGTGSLLVDGSSTLNNTVDTTSVLLQSGTLNLTAPGQLPTSVALSSSGGSLSLGGFSHSIASLQLNGGSIANGTLSSSGDYDLRSGSVSAQLNGSGNLNKTGAGTVVLSSANGYGGATTVADGVLSLDTGAALPSTTALTLTGGTLAIGSTSPSVSSLSLRGGEATGSGTLTSATTYDLRSGNVSASLGGGVGATKTGSGSVTLSGANSYGGSTTVSQGTLVAANALALGNTGGGTTVASGAVLQIDGAAIGNETLTLNGTGLGSGALVGNGTASLAGAVTLQTDAAIGVTAGSTLTLSNSIGGGASALRKLDDGRLQLAASNTYSGATSVDAGTLALMSAERLNNASAVTIANGATLALNGTETVAALTVAGTLDGTGGSTLVAPTYALQAGALINAGLGAGSLSVAGNSLLNGSAGATTVQVTGGRLTLGSAHRLADTAALTVGSGAELMLNGNDTVGSLALNGGSLLGTGTLTAGTYALAGATVAADLGSGALTNTGISTLSGLVGANTVSVDGSLSATAANRFTALPDVTVNGGASLALAGSETLGRLSGAGNVANAGTLATGSGGDAVFSGVLSGAGGLAKQGSSVFTLANANSYAGGTSITAGRLVLGADNALGSGAVSVTGGTLDLGTRSDTVSTLTVQNGTLDGTSGVLTATTYALGNGAAVNAKLGIGTLTSDGAVALNGTAAAGTVTVATGTLTLGPAGRLADTAAVGISGGATLKLNGNDTVGSLTAAGTLAGTTAGDTLTAASYALSSGAVIEANLGAGALTSNGTAALNGTAAAATINVATGTLTLGSANRLADPAAVSVATGATLKLNGNDTVGTLATGGRLAATGANDTLTAATYALSNGAAVDANLGAGVLTTSGAAALNGTAAAASVNVTSSGALTLGAADRLADVASVDIASGGTLKLNGSDTVGALTAAGTLTKTGAGDKLTAATYTLNNGAVVDAKLGAGVFNANGAVSLTDDLAALTVHVVTGTLTVGNGGNTGSLDNAAIVDGSGTIAFNRSDNVTVGSTLAGNLGLTKLAANTLTLSGSNTYSGATTINAGTLRVAGGSALPDSGTVTLADVAGATLDVAASETFAVLNGGGTTGGAVTLGSGQTLTISGGSFAGAISGAGALAKTGAGTLALSGSNSFTGGATLVGGTLSVSGGNALPDSGVLTLSNVAGVTLDVLASETLGTLNGGGATGGGVALAGAQTLTVGSGAFAGAISGTGVLAKAGAGTLALSGANSYSGGTAVTSGKLTLAANDVLGSGAVSVNGGALDLGAQTDTVSALTVQSGSVDGTTGVLTAATYALNTGAVVNGNLGAGALTSNGAVNLGGTSAAATVNVATGTLALGSANRLADPAAVTIASGAALKLNGNDTVGSLTSAGALNGTNGADTLTAASYALNDGAAVNANLGTGTLASNGLVNLVGTAGAITVNVATGTLTLKSEERLADAAAVGVANGATLKMDGKETIGTLTSAGIVNFASTITTSGNQTYTGTVLATAGNAAPALIAADSADITASNTGNDFDSGPLQLRARSVQLVDGSAELALGAVTLGAGTSTITGVGTVQLRDKLALNGGVLTLASQATATAGSPVTSSTGAPAFLPDPKDGSASSRQPVYASKVINQTATGDIVATAESTLHLQSSGGGSIELRNAGNRFGNLSALSGGSNGFDLAAAIAGDGRISQVAIKGDALRLVAAPGANANGDAVRADVVSLSGNSLSTAPGSVIRARLPYSVNQGPASQPPALTLDIAGAATAEFGTARSPVTVAVERPNAANGIGGLYLTVLPAPVSGTQPEAQVFLGCTGCTGVPVYQFGGKSYAVETFFNGTLLTDAPPAASAITSNTTLLENARRSLFEAAVRTENVGPRLRAGVIAEVGTGRPATEGSGGAKRPTQCDAVAGGLSCDDAK